eukprot:5529362-Amphidinium_carterae.1
MALQSNVYLADDIQEVLAPQNMALQNNVYLDNVVKKVSELGEPPGLADQTYVSFIGLTCDIGYGLLDTGAQSA